MGLEAVKENDSCVVIKVKGRFDFSCHASFREAYAKAPDGCEFVVDMEEASYMDSAALGMLLLLREHVQNKAVASPSSTVVVRPTTSYRLPTFTSSSISNPRRTRSLVTER
jgi:anti-anti-sigma factor